MHIYSLIQITEYVCILCTEYEIICCKYSINNMHIYSLI